MAENPDDLGFKKFFDIGPGGVTETYVQAAWGRLSQGKKVLFHDLPGSLEAAIQAAADAGRVHGPEDVRRVVEAHYAARAAAMPQAREALAALPDEAAHALDPEPGSAPSGLPPGVPPPPPDLPAPEPTPPPVGEPARTPYLDPPAAVTPAGPPAAALSPGELRQLARLAGSQAAAEALLKALQGQGAVAGPPALPPAEGLPAVAEPGTAAGTSPGGWADLPPPEDYEGTPFLLPGLPAPPPPPVLGLHDLLGAAPVLGPEHLAPPAPVLGAEHLGSPGGGPAPEAARAPEAAPAPFAWPVLGEADVAPDETWYHPFREPGAGAGRDAVFGGGEVSGGGEGPGIMAVLERIASGIDRLVDIMSQGGAGDSGPARFRRPDFGDPEPDWDDDEDDDPDVLASPSVDRYDLWRPGQDRVETSQPEGRRRPRQPKHHDEPGTGVG